MTSSALHEMSSRLGGYLEISRPLWVVGQLIALLGVYRFLDFVHAELTAEHVEPNRKYLVAHFATKCGCLQAIIYGDAQGSPNLDIISLMPAKDLRMMPTLTCFCASLMGIIAKMFCSSN